MKLQDRSSMRRYTCGMTLVEVLIAAVVIAVGLLGIASLQINALQSTTNAQNRSKAMDVIAAMADRVKANPLGIASYTDTIPVDACNLAPNAPLASIERCAMSPDGDIAVVGQCTPAEMAAYDLWETNCYLQSALPGALLELTCPVGGCTEIAPMTITISWQAQNRNPDGAVVTPANTVTQEVAATIFLPGAPPAPPGAP